MAIVELLEEIVQGPTELPHLGTSLVLQPTQETPRLRRFPSQAVVVTAAARRLIELSKAGERVDSVVVLGDPDPTAHPEIQEISSNLRELCKKWFPKANLCLIADRPRLDSLRVRRALSFYDRPHVRLETGTQRTYGALTGDAPQAFKVLLEGLGRLEHRGLVIRARFVRGSIDNSTDNEVKAWIRYLGHIKPAAVQISTPPRGSGKIRPITKTRMAEIRELVTERTGIPVEILDRD